MSLFCPTRLLNTQVIYAWVVDALTVGTVNDTADSSIWPCGQQLTLTLTLVTKLCRVIS